MIKALTTTALIALALPAFANEEIEQVKKMFNEIQPLSFKHNREYCGYIGWDKDENLVFTKARKGWRNSCRAYEPPEDLLIFASYHTHGAFHHMAAAEFPTSSDVEGDEAEGVDGYVATPGGRLWYIDSESLTVHQICGIGCLKSDPDFVPGMDGHIKKSYTLKELIALENGDY